MAAQGQWNASTRAFPRDDPGGILERQKRDRHRPWPGTPGRARHAREARGFTVNVEKLRTVDDWAAYYRHAFGLPATERGGFVMLPITSRACVIHLPTERAHAVRELLDSRDIRVPVLARQIRWSFVAYPDRRPDPEVVEMLHRIQIDIPGLGSAVMLPTGMGRWNREGCNWVVPPERDGLLPPLSSVINAALLAGGNQD